MINYIQGCVLGTAVGDLDDFIDRWHDAVDDGPPLHEYLGMTKEEYRVVVKCPDALPLIIEKYRSKAALANITREIINIKSSLYKHRISAEKRGEELEVVNQDLDLLLSTLFRNGIKAVRSGDKFIISK